MGGLGLRSTERHSLGVYLTSIIAIRPLLESLLLHGSTDTDHVSPLFLVGQRLGKDISVNDIADANQKSLSSKIDTCLRGSLTPSANLETRPD